jgi:hypothetical protein
MAEYIGHTSQFESESESAISQQWEMRAEIDQGVSRAQVSYERRYDHLEQLARLSRATRSHPLLAAIWQIAPVADRCDAKAEDFGPGTIVRFNIAGLAFGTLGRVTSRRLADGSMSIHPSGNPEKIFVTFDGISQAILVPLNAVNPVNGGANHTEGN